MNHRSNKALISLLVCLACILAGLVLVVSIDAPPPQDADLLLFYCPPPEERNGYVILQKAGDLLTGQEEIEALAASTQPDPAAISRLLVANEAALREVFFKKNATLRACAEHYRAELARIDGKGAPDPKERSRPRPSLWAGNIFGQAIVALMIPSFERQYASVTGLEERARQVLASLQRLSSRPNRP